MYLITERIFKKYMDDYVLTSFSIFNKLFIFIQPYKFNLHTYSASIILVRQYYVSSVHIPLTCCYFHKKTLTFNCNTVLALIGKNLFFHFFLVQKTSFSVKQIKIVM